GVAARLEEGTRVATELPRERRRRGWIVRQEMRLDVARRVVAALRAVHDAVEQVLLRVQEAEAEVRHQPLEARARGEVHAGGLHVDRRRAGGLDDVGVYVRAVRVRQVAHRL